MRSVIAVLSAFTVLALVACSPGGNADVQSRPSTAAPPGNEAACREFAQQLIQMSSPVIRAASVLADPAADAGQTQKAISDVKAEVARLRSWVDTQLPGIANSEVKSAFDGFRMELALVQSEMDAAGNDGHKVMDSITEGRLSAAEQRVHVACGRRSPSPAASAQ